MNNQLAIWGAGGHGKVVIDIAAEGARFGPICFLDDDAEKSGTALCGYPVLGGPEMLRRLAGSWFVIAVGGNEMRARRFDLARAAGLCPAVLVHSTAAVSPLAAIGEGTVVMPGAVINAGAAIGPNCIINSGAIVEHDCRIGANAHISPRAALGGAARVGDFAHVGMGAVVLPGASIGPRCIVGAGAVVLREAPAHTTVIGVPARVRAFSKLV